MRNKLKKKKLNKIKERCIDLEKAKSKKIINDIPNVNFDISLTINEVLLLISELEFAKEGVLDSIYIDGNDSEKARLVVINNLLQDLTDFEIDRTYGSDILNENGKYWIKIHLYELDYFCSLLEIGVDIANGDNDEIRSKSLFNILKKAQKHYKNYDKAIINLFEKYSYEERAELLMEVYYKKYNF